MNYVFGDELLQMRLCWLEINIVIFFKLMQLFFIINNSLIIHETLAMDNILKCLLAVPLEKTRKQQIMSHLDGLFAITGWTNKGRDGTTKPALFSGERPIIITCSLSGDKMSLL